VYAGEHRVGKAQLVKRFSVVIEGNHSGDLLAQRLHLWVAERISSRLHSQLKSIAELLGRNPDLAFIVPVQAECHPHYSVEAALVAMSEAHRRDLAQVERTNDVHLCGQYCRRHCVRHSVRHRVRHAFVILFVIIFVTVFVIAITSSVCDAALTFLVSRICTPTLGVCHRLGQRFPGSDGLCRGAGS
jgi:hypothetical protein